MVQQDGASERMRDDGAPMDAEERQTMAFFASLMHAAVSAFHEYCPGWEPWISGTIISPTGEVFIVDGHPADIQDRVLH